MMSSQLKFAPFNSALDTGFWHKLSQQKIDVYGLDDHPKKINGFFFNGDAAGLPCRLTVDFSSFDETTKTPPRHFISHGCLKNTNTVDDFKECDKKALLDELGTKLWDDILSGNAIRDPTLLTRFFVLTFADLKKYHYYYWFAFPALCAPEVISIVTEPQPIETRFSDTQISSLLDIYGRDFLPKHVAFFLARVEGDSLQVAALSDFDQFVQAGKCILCVCDPCTLEAHPGWPLRSLLTLAAYHWAEKLGGEVEVLCLRDRTKDGRREVSHSIVFKVALPSISHLTECPRVVGWEKNEKQKMAPRKVNLSSSMDPSRLAESAVDLNLKLMRWRLLPDLDLDKITSTKCLLLGAGTLGCNVARNLLAWGVRTMTLVDNGTVSYSNPVRQSLFTFEDSLNGGRPKAEAAAEALKRIFPGVNAVGLSMSIPMPGHPVIDGLVEQTAKDVAILEELVDKHDVVFLLMDTRESRWLPTLLGKSKEKIVMNAALGFDTFLVVRHGVKPENDPMDTGVVSVPLNAPVPGDNLGCYFCNDVVAPGNSTRDRTLDQQCTVSRPGMSMIASALTVELFVSLLQHPDGGRAAAETSARDEHLTKDTTSPLGLVPHQIRGFLSRYHQILPANIAFEKCTACSPLVQQKYTSEGFDFLLNVFNNPTYLEEVTGLRELHANTLDAEVWELSDEDLSSMD